MSFNIEDAFSKATSTTSQRIDISAVLTAIRAKVKTPISAVVSVKTQDLVIIFGDSSVVASDTLTGDKYPTGNYPIIAGTVQEIIIPRGATHMAFKAAGIGEIKAAIGYNE